MDRDTFEREMMRVKTMMNIQNRDYWAGYQRGLLRKYHGEKFGTNDEHEKWMSMAGDTDKGRADRGQGYRDGFNQG
ncbi:MAG: hypothetical protein JSV38_15845 [Desulfobacterales bacterium]|nr:MAG: hypothetical protein JSV38_15845 [Desulfobacterales bacterium]